MTERLKGLSGDRPICKIDRTDKAGRKLQALARSYVRDDNMEALIALRESDPNAFEHSIKLSRQRISYAHYVAAKEAVEKCKKEGIPI